jgi:NAD(P)-dependent dehydrogenase (short-subunit alcohol dehydrogenase family)
LAGERATHVVLVDHRVQGLGQGGQVNAPQMVHHHDADAAQVLGSRIAVVAGAGGGLGQATVRLLHAAGLTAVGVDRSPAKLADLPAGVHREYADVTDPAVAEPLLQRVAAQVGEPQILVNVVGMHALGDFRTVTPDRLRALIDVNLGTALWLTQAVAPYMARQGGGVIIHSGARAGLEAAPGAAAYGVTKAALAHLGRILDLELRPQGIRVHVILPRLIATAANKAVLPPQLLSSAATPEAVAGVIMSLVADRPAAVQDVLVPV